MAPRDRLQTAKRSQSLKWMHEHQQRLFLRTYKSSSQYHRSGQGKRTPKKDSRARCNMNGRKCLKLASPGRHLRKLVSSPFNEHVRLVPGKLRYALYEFLMSFRLIRRTCDVVKDSLPYMCVGLAPLDSGSVNLIKTPSTAA